MAKYITDKPIEISLYIRGYEKECNCNIENPNKFSEHIVMSGYSESDIAEALSMLRERNNFLSVQSSEIGGHNTTSIKMLSDFERIKITPEVYGYTVKLKNMSIISGT